jgi:hypothetical protein
LKSTGIVVGQIRNDKSCRKKSEIIKTIGIQDAEEEEGLGELYELPLNDEYASSTTNKVLNYLQFYAEISINFGKKIDKASDIGEDF